jgi:hypothetical protein
MILAEDDYHAIANVATSWTNVGFHSLFDEHRVLILDGEHQGDDGQDNLAGEGARVDPASLGVEVDKCAPGPAVLPASRSRSNL